MEKFTKFDDKRTGVNPFLPPRTEKLNAILWILKLVLILPMVLVKIALLITLYPPYLVLHMAKYAFVWNVLIRLMERVVDKIFCTVFEHCFGIMNYVSAYHHEHPLYSRIVSTGDHKPVESDPVRNGDIILYSGGSFLDYVYLTEKYSPVFCTIAKDDSETDNDQLVKLSWPQTLSYTIGLKFPKMDKARKYETLDEIISRQYVKRPIVILIEGTKTNGKGVLELSQNVLDQVLTLVETKNMRLHSVTIRYSFSYYAPYNTTDPTGIWHFLGCLTQFYNKLIATHYFNIERIVVEEKDRRKKAALVKKCLITRDSPFDLSLTATDHERFIRYWYKKRTKKYVARPVSK